MNAKGVCPIGCEYAIGGAWYAFGLEEAKPRRTEAAGVSNPSATQGNKEEPSSNIKHARQRWVSKIRAVTPCRGRHWPSTPDEVRQLQSRLLWGSSDMWSAVKNRDDEARAKSAGKSSRREGEQRSPQAQPPESDVRQQEARRPTPPQQQQAAGPPASDDEGPRSNSEAILSIQLHSICLRPPYQGMRWDLLHSERARQFAAEKSLTMFKEFQATMWEEVQKDAKAYLLKPPTERSVMESQKAIETIHRTIAKNMYKEFETYMKRKLADIQNGNPDNDDLVDSRDAKVDDRPDEEETRQPGIVDDSDRNRLSGKHPTSEGHRRNTHQAEERPRQRAAHPRAMHPEEPARRPYADQEMSGYPPRSADIRHNDSRIPSMERHTGSFASGSGKPRMPQPVPAAAPHHQTHIVDSLDASTQYEAWGSHRRSQSENGHEFGSLPPTQFLDPTYIPAPDKRQSRMRSGSSSGDSRPQRAPNAEATGARYRYPSFPQSGGAASEVNGGRPPPPRARPDSVPIGHRVPPSSYGATPLRYMPTTVEKTVPPQLSDETIDPNADELNWLDPYCSAEYVADQYTNVANEFKEPELDKEFYETLSDLEEGRLQKISSAISMAQARAPVPATAPVLRSSITPKSSRVPPLVASSESNTDSDSDATVSDSTMQSESESNETPTQSTYNSPLAGVRIPNTLTSLVGQRPPTTARNAALRMEGQQAVDGVLRPERREVHFAEKPAVRYFRG